eukprot:1419284-Pyramimonas_sp.AAC.1
MTSWSRTSTRTPCCPSLVRDRHCQRHPLVCVRSPSDTTNLSRFCLSPTSSKRCSIIIILGLGFASSEGGLKGVYRGSVVAVTCIDFQMRRDCM